MNLKSEIFNKTLGGREGSVQAEKVSVILSPQASVPANLQNLLTNGEWGKAFIGLVQGVQTFIGITEGTIEGIFKWGANVDANKKTSYVQIIENLLKLPSGIALFRDVIIAYHLLPGLPKLEFGSATTPSKFYRNSDWNCRINLKWNGNANVNRHTNDNWILIVKNNSLIADPNHRGAQIDFLDVEVGPEMILAHEMGHYLHELINRKKCLETEIPHSVDEFVSKETLDDYMVATAAIQARANSPLICKSVDVIGQLQYGKILEDVLPTNKTLFSRAEMAFVDAWNSSYDDIVNILPTLGILGNNVPNYSDGAIIGEAAIANTPGVTVNFQPRPRVQVQYPLPCAQNFVRFSHQDAQGFWDIFNKLANIPGAQDEFKDLTDKLLDKMKVASNNLPVLLPAVPPAAAGGMPPAAGGGTGGGTKTP